MPLVSDALGPTICVGEILVEIVATSAAARIGWSEKIEALANRAGHLHVMGSALSVPTFREVIERVAGTVRAQGGSLSLDPNLRKELKHDADTEACFARLVGMSDLLLPSGEELELSAGVDGEDAAVERLFEVPGRNSITSSHRRKGSHDAGAA